MNKQALSSRTLLSLALLATCLAGASAHAGVIGGAGGLNGSVGPRSIDVGAQARGSVQRSGELSNKARETAATVDQKANESKAAATGAVRKAATTPVEAKAETRATGGNADASTSSAANVSRADRSVNASASHDTQLSR